MSSIGIYNFITVKGAVNLKQQRLEPFSRPGVNGESFQAIGARAEVSTFTSTGDVASLSSAANLLAAYSNLVDSVVSITDDLGVTWRNMLVTAVRQVSARRIIIGVGGLVSNPAAMHVVEWEFKAL